MPYVYRHIRLDTNEPFYVGIGSDEFYKRAHNQNNRNKHWKNIVSTHGYKVQIVIDDLTWDEACAKEMEFIALYKRTFEGGLLVNITAGGEGNLNPSPETRMKISNSQKGDKNSMHGKPKNKNWYQAMEKLKGEGNPNHGKKIPDWHKEILRNTHLGKKQSAETVAKKSMAIKGKKRSLESREKMSEAMGKKVIDTSTNTIYKNITAAAKAFGYNRRTLNAWLSGALTNKSTLIYFKHEGC